MTRYVLHASLGDVSVEADDSGVIRFADAIARRFVGQNVSALKDWLEKYGPVEVKQQDAAPRLF